MRDHGERDLPFLSEDQKYCLMTDHGEVVDPLLSEVQKSCFRQSESLWRLIISNFKFGNLKATTNLILYYCDRIEFTLRATLLSKTKMCCSATRVTR
jgi:hypothetical protein